MASSKVLVLFRSFLLGAAVESMSCLVLNAAPHYRFHQSAPGLAKRMVPWEGTTGTVRLMVVCTMVILWGINRAEENSRRDFWDRQSEVLGARVGGLAEFCRLHQSAQSCSSSFLCSYNSTQSRHLRTSDNMYAAALFILGHLAQVMVAAVPRSRQDSTPSVLPDRQPFGFAKDVTGGGDGTVYVVDNMMDLRTALTKAEPRTVYVKGEIKGNQINETFSGNCQFYIDTSNVPNYNFTLYVMSLNSTYTSAVKAAVAANETFEGKNATEYLALLSRQNVSC